ncbi:MAG: N-acetyl-gamma-glutamyl-phosphate reductase [Pseudomonadota bacterium]
MTAPFPGPPAAARAAADSARGGPNASKRVAVLGASGYTGAELIRLLLGHPGFEIAAATADRKAGKSLGEVFPHLGHMLPLDLVRIEELDPGGIDLAFCALPHGATHDLLRRWPEHVAAVDLSADFRLEDPAAYERWYGAPHTALALQQEAVYGLPEFYRAEIAEARIVANTGCYVATSLLPLIPLLRAGAIDPDPIIIDAKSGVSGAGRAAREGALFCEVAEGFHAYGIGGHRHMAEIDQELSKAAGAPVQASFTPHLLPQNRGILATIYVRGDAKRIHETLFEAHKDEPFIRVLPFGQAPQTRHVRGSNFAHMGVVADRAPGRAIVLATLDNLVKGASGQALQCANIMCGFEETMGLTQAPLFP